MDDKARDEMLAAAHAALSALKAADAVMTRHADAKIGEDAALRIGAIHREIQGTIWVLDLRLAPVKPSPRVVLEAMLRAYEAAALDAMRAAFEAENEGGESDEEDGVYSAEWQRFDALDEMLTELREETAYLATGRGDFSIVNPTTLADYEARLRGERPLDAPPLEAP